MLKQYEIKLKRLPTGKLVCLRKKEKEEYYYIDAKDKKRKYINKENLNLVDDLKLRKHIETSIKRLKQNVEVQQRMLLKYKPYSYGAIQQVVPMSYKFGDNGAGNILTKDKKKFKNQPLYLTSAGYKVRSKSEAMIVEALCSDNIVAEYEKPLYLKIKGRNVIKIYPDFTFTNKYGLPIYWEHFGMLSNEIYKEDMLRKLETYIDNGIIPSVNLIITAEKLDGSFDMGVISRTVDMIKKML